MEHKKYGWGQKKHARTILSAVAYWLTKFAYRLAPNKMTKLMREKGFRVKPYHLTQQQRELANQAHTYFLKFNHNKIKVYEWGSGPVLLLVHGWAGRALQMDAFITPLLNKGYKVVAFDHKGHGESSSRFSSFPEIARSTELVATHYAGTLLGIVAHSIGSNAAFKASENIEQQLKIVAVAPMEKFIGFLEKMRMKMGIDENLFAQVVRQIEIDSELSLGDLCVLDYEKIGRHDVLLVHDKFDRMNKISSSYDIQNNLHGTLLVETEKLGHSRILSNHDVVRKIAEHFPVQLK